MYFDKKVVSVNKQIIQRNNRVKFEFSDTKTRDSRRADSNIYLRRTKIATLAGLKVIMIHDFRHSCASLLIYNDANVSLVAKYLGHTKIVETLNIFTYV
ncbi:MAG: tyrosine-type recombinase/integrase [Bacilli bacterium]|nr:tyrosine-type recombinase/integrase [Bacilli bacterium]